MPVKYSERFGFPVLDEFELRGSNRDVERIAAMLLEKSKHKNRPVEILRAFLFI